MSQVEKGHVSAALDLFAGGRIMPPVHDSALYSLEAAGSEIDYAQGGSSDDLNETMYRRNACSNQLSDFTT